MGAEICGPSSNIHPIFFVTSFFGDINSVVRVVFLVVGHHQGSQVLCHFLGGFLVYWVQEWRNDKL